MTILPNSDMETFPFLSNQNSKIHALKAKGTPAKVKRNMTLADFSDTIVKKQNPRKVKIHSMRRTNFKISIVFFGIFFTLFHQQEAFNFHDKVSTT